MMTTMISPPPKFSDEAGHETGKAAGGHGSMLPVEVLGHGTAQWIRESVQLLHGDPPTPGTDPADDGRGVLHPPGAGNQGGSGDGDGGEGHEGREPAAP